MWRRHFATGVNPPAARVFNVDWVEGSPAVALTDAQVDELRLRSLAHRADPSSTVPWEEVRVELLHRKQ